MFPTPSDEGKSKLTHGTQWGHVREIESAVACDFAKDDAAGREDASDCQPGRANEKVFAGGLRS